MTLEKLPHTNQFRTSRPRNFDRYHDDMLSWIEKIYYDFAQRLNAEITITEEIVDGSTPLDHGVLGGLGDDDHTIYLKEKASGGLAAEIPIHTHVSAAQAGTLHHGALTGLGDDDHPQYLLADGTRDLTGDWTIATNNIILSAGTLTAEQLTSTDDITMQGHLLTLGDGTATDIVMSFQASAHDASITFDESANEFDFGASYITASYFEATTRASAYKIDGQIILARKDTSNLMVGFGSGIALDTGNYNFLFGGGINIEDGDHNTCLGYNAAFSLTSASNGIFLGARAGGKHTDQDGRLIIDAFTRTNLAEDISHPIIYGIMALDPELQSLDLNVATLSIGTDANQDVAVHFKASVGTNSGLFTWKDDENYFEFTNEIRMPTTQRISFRDANAIIYSPLAGQLGLGATVEIDFYTSLLALADPANISLGTTTGTKIGIATNQKLGFWNTTPVVQPAHIIDANGTLGDITTKFNTLLAQLATTGMQAAA